MRWLRGFCLACSLLAAALLPGPRQAPAAAAAAFEAGLGFSSDAEPDAGEAKGTAYADIGICRSAGTNPSRILRKTKFREVKSDRRIFNYMRVHAPNPASMAYVGTDLEEQLRSVSSVDELMTVLYPEYWKMYKCQLRRGSWQQNKEQPNVNTRTEDTIKFAAAHYNAEILKSIDNEWRKTQCMPREVCIDVGKEFGAATNTFFKPPCVSVYRCGGCCNSEGLQCMNTSTGYLSKTLFEITVPLSQGPKPVTISFANHTSCRCMSKLDVYRQVHSIIRRSLPATLPQCQAANKTCPTNYTWNHHLCRCLTQQDFLFASSSGEDSVDGFHDICGPNKELDEETCQCVCKGGLRPSSCGPYKELDRDSCQCVCKNKLFPNSCGANRAFDENTCQCICKRTCPRSQPLNPGKCACECTENSQKCLLKGKKFHNQTCSCYRRPCTNRLKHCEQGLSFSEEVCRCVPSYWKRPHIN